MDFAQRVAYLSENKNYDTVMLCFNSWAPAEIFPRGGANTLRKFSYILPSSIYIYIYLY